jgi:hypothetical protein
MYVPLLFILILRGAKEDALLPQTHSENVFVLRVCLRHAGVVPCPRGTYFFIHAAIISSIIQ